MPLVKTGTENILPTPTMALALAAAALLAGCSNFPPARAIRIGTASTSQTVCMAAFVSGVDPDASYLEEVRPERGIGLIAWGLHYRIDRDRREAVADFAGTSVNRAVFREGMGCVVDHGNLTGFSWRRPDPAEGWVDPFPGLAVPAPVAPSDERVRAAIDEAFEEPNSGRPRRTKAVVVVHRGKILGERYAPGVGERTPLPAHSISKSVTHALVGILVREHKLDPERPLGLKEWSVPGDARASITANQLLAMAGGLPWDERMGGFDQSTRLWFDEADPYGYAVTVEADALPGTHWAYSNVGYTVLSRLVRDHVGGGAREVLEFAHRELFDRLGMRDAMLTLDGTGTPMGANLFLASARDWARFGLLYLNHGAAGAWQLLPADWADAAHVQTLDAGYGRGFWLNVTASSRRDPTRGITHPAATRCSPCPARSTSRSAGKVRRLGRATS
jgi:CubicO group peptidase (beta-lactamase class C family)